MCQFTLPGQPVIYHGMDVGLSQEHVVHEPGRCLEGSAPASPVGDQQDRFLLAYFRALIALRRSQPLLRNGKRQFVKVEVDGLTYKLSSPDGGSQGSLWVALNLSSFPWQLFVQGEWTSVLAMDDNYHANAGKEGPLIIPSSW